MKIVAAVSLSLFLGVSGFAQSQSVWIEELTTDEVRAAVAAGKTTAIYYTGGLHQNGAVVVNGKHLIIARYVAQRVAEELGNTLVLPINPYVPAFPGGDPTKKEGHLRAAGSISVTDETYGAIAREVVTSAIVATGFKNVMLMGDHGFGMDTEGVFDGGRLKKVAEELDAEWRSRGTRVYYIPVDGEVDHRMIPDYLTQRNVPAKVQTSVDDISEVWSVDQKGIREDKIPPDIRTFVSPELGRTFTELKVSTILRHVRRLTSMQ